MEHKHKIFTGTIFLVIGLISLFLVSSDNFTGNVATNGNTGSIKANVLPQGIISVYLDNVLKQRTGNDGKIDLKNILVGVHKLELQRPGFVNYIDNNVRVSLQRATNLGTIRQIMKGSLSINSNPIGAKLFIDNIDTGRITPVINYQINPSGHVIKLTKTGYQDYTNNNVNIISGQTTNLGSVILTVLPSKNIYISIKLSDGLNFDKRLQNAIVTLDSDSLNTKMSDFNGLVIFNNVPYGDHTLTVSKDGFLTYTNIINVNQIDSNVYNINLIPIATGSAYFTSNIPARVYSNYNYIFGLGKDVGSTPILINGIGVGQRQVYINNTNNFAILKTFNIVEGQTTNVEAIFP